MKLTVYEPTLRKWDVDESDLSRLVIERCILELELVTKLNINPSFCDHTLAIALHVVCEEA